MSWLARTCLLLPALAFPAAAGAAERSLTVVATAYNSLPGQTQGDPRVAAWGDVLVPGMRSVAVSPDLLKLGLRRGVRVRIDGLRGEFVVLDKMPARWRRRIDLYMGVDEAAALAWGRRTVTLRFDPERVLELPRPVRASARR
jgi:3D (Asp-Asp-Asp) domain-containing protein